MHGGVYDMHGGYMISLANLPQACVTKLEVTMSAISVLRNAG